MCMIYIRSIYLRVFTHEKQDISKSKRYWYLHILICFLCLSISLYLEKFVKHWGTSFHSLIESIICIVICKSFNYTVYLNKYNYDQKKWTYAWSIFSYMAFHYKIKIFFSSHSLLGSSPFINKYINIKICKKSLIFHFFLNSIGV